MSVKTCSACGESKEAENFYKDKQRKDGLNVWCKPCTSAYNMAYYRRRKDEPGYMEANRAHVRKWRAKNIEKVRKNDRERRRIKKYGVSPEVYAQMLADQEGRCAICRRHQDDDRKSFCVDHCHDTGKVRGILCFSCNVGIGAFKESLHNIRAADSYLSGHYD